MLNFTSTPVEEVMYTITIDGHEWKLNEQNTQRIIDIMNAMVSGKTISPVATPVAPEKKKSTSRRSSYSPDVKWGDRTVKYTVNQIDNVFVVDAELFNSKGEKCYAKHGSYVTRVIGELFTDAPMKTIEYTKSNGKPGKYTRPFFNTRAEADKYITTRPTTVSGDHCKAVQDQIRKEWGN